MQWVEHLNAPRNGFRPLKHRRFRFDVSTSTAANWLHLLADDRSAVAQASGDLQGSVSVDVHSFHAAVSPPLA